MEAALVGGCTGVMKPLLSKLSNLLEKEYAKLKGVRREFESTRAEIRSMKAALEALAEAEPLDPEMIEWRDEVRELSFDMEDCVDDFMARADTKQDGRKGLKGFFDKLKKLKPRHEIAGEIKELKARAIESSERHKRYKLDRSTPDFTTCDIDPRLHALYVEAGKLVGIKGPKKHIIDWFKNEGSSTQLRVVSIVGPGGLGKTTLGKAVFETIKEEFSCKAFVSVSRNPNMKIVLKDISRRVGMAHDPSNDDEQWLIDSLREHLQDKKYLIVIDDLWSAEAWKTIKDALVNNEHGSRIITTTRNSAVASFCSSEGDYVYRMEPLSSVDSRRLFLVRAFRSEDLCPPHLNEVSERILEKCAGLPLAIITMSSLLADQTAEEVWNKALAAVGSSLAKEDGAGDMTKILSLSYFDLPHYMRACLLYLSAYPEDYIIEKKRLIHTWMAEGFIRDVEGQSTYEVGEGYFNDFINKSLIQPAELSHFEVGYGQEQYGEVMACRVHDIILDFITCKAKEENFMTSFGDAEHGGKHKVRRLFVVSRDNGGATVLGDLSHVRSLAVFGYVPQNFALDFPVLRVLDIERCHDLESDHLANIEKLILLKYLRLRSSYSIIEIPEGIGKLKYLETFDMRGVTITKLPSTMRQLQRLARLYAKFKPACLSDGIIGQLQSLEEIEEIQVSETELEKFLQELGQLTKLRTLSVCVKRSTLSEKVDNVRFLETLISSYNLHHLTIRYDTDYARECLLSLESWCLVNPVALRKICIHDYSIDKVPNWMISLGNLSVLHLSEMYCTGPEDMAIIGGMPALVALKLTTWYGRNGKIFIRTGFRSLKYFSLYIYCCGTAVEFEEGSMPKLEHLELKFKAHKEECVNYAFDFGIQHLSALTKLDLRTIGDDDIIHKLIETALGKFRHRPTLSWKREAYKMCSHFETALEREWEEKKEREKENGERGGPCSFLGLLLEEIKQDALPRMRVMGMLRSLDDLNKSLCAAAPPAAAESAAVACALSEIQREISSTDGPTKATASCHHCAIARHLLTSPAAAAAAPDDLFVHLAQDLVPHLASGSPNAIAEATRVLAASPSAVFSILFKPLTSCLASPDTRASTAAAAAFCELSAPPTDVAPFLPLAPQLCNLLTTSHSNCALINVLRVLARLAPSLESSLLVVDPVCQLLAHSSDMFLTFQCIRTVLAAQKAHGASLAIRKVKEFLSGARDPNLGLLALGKLYPGYVNECRDVMALLLNDGFNSNIRREALHLLMDMVDSDNIMGIAGMLVSHAAKSDPEFANEILGAVLAACARNVYDELVMDLDWYVSLLTDMARSVSCAAAWGDEIARQLVDVGLRVRDARPELVHAVKTLLIDPALLGNHLFCPVLSAAAWVSGEYAEFIKDPVELVEALLQPRTSLLPMSVRAIYIQAAHKVITSCCSIYLERRSADSNKELDAVFKWLAIDQTSVSGGSKAAIGSGQEQQIVDKDFFSDKSILHMIKLIEAKVGPLVECIEVEVLERARNLIGFVHLIKETQEASDDEKFIQAKELVRNMQIVFSQELSPVSVCARNHPYFRSGHCQGKDSTQPDVVPQAPCNSKTNIRGQPYISAGTLPYFGDTQRFESVFKVKRRTFNYICCLVKPVEDITLLDGRVLVLQDQVAIALRMFICAAPVETVLSDVGVSRSTFGLIFWRFVEAMLKQASHHLFWPDSMKMESTKSKFELIHGMPNCCGVVDTTCITTTLSAEPNCDHEKNHSIAVQTVVDPDSRIIDFFMGWSDNTLQSSHLFEMCKKALAGSKLKLSDESEVGEYIIGDAGNPLLPWLLTPYQEKDLSGPKLEFNRRHFAARTISQRLLARLKDTWKWMYLGGSCLFSQELFHFLTMIIRVSCLLHNIVIDMEGAALEEESIPSNHDTNYRPQACQLADENAVRVRDILSQHLANRSSKFGGTLSFLEDEKIFESFFKMKRRTFNYICCLVKSMEDVTSYTFLDGRVMCWEDQVAVALRMLISGGPVETVASVFSIKESTVSLVTFRFAEAMMKRGSYHMSWPDSIKMEKIKSKFDLIHMLPNCCGVIDTTYISSAEPNHSHEKNYSMAVQVVVDSDMRFICCHLELSGTKKKQSRNLHSSLIGTQHLKGEWLNGGKVKLSDGSEVGEYIIGVVGFPLLPWLLTPYREKDLSDPKVEFNRRLSAARAITLRGLARLKDTWKCLHGELLRPENPREFSNVIVVCCMLHNIVIDMEGKAVEEEYVPNSCGVNYSQKVCRLRADPNSVRTRDALSRQLASRPLRSAGDEEKQIVPSDAGDEEEEE